MNAIVSGRSGRALIIEGDSLRSFDVNDPSKIVPRQKADLPYLFGEASDLRILENTSLESVERELRNERNFTWALDLTLISLDAEQPGDIREEGIVALEELIANDKTVEKVENVLYAQVLPDTADLKGALELCDKRKTSHEFLWRLHESQPRISAVSCAWESIPTESFVSPESRNEFRAVAVREGLFRKLVLGLPTTITVFRHAASNPSIQKLPNHQRILAEWKYHAQPLLSPNVDPTPFLTAIKQRIKAIKEARGTVEVKKPLKKRKSKPRERTAHIKTRE